MACTSPLYRVPFVSKNFPLLTAYEQQRLKNHGVFLKWDVVQSKIGIPGWDPDEVQVLPCGQCTNCRLNYSRDWAIRCSLEAARHEHNYFVTLTYDDYHLPRGEFLDYKGDFYESELNRRDVQLFLKSLREWERIQNDNVGIKVFYCGEYGALTSRPHYHLCLFGVSEIPDLRFHCQRGSYKYYKSSLYESFWSENKVLRGFVDISEVSFDTIAYTARYVMKKQQGVLKKDFLEYYETLDPLNRPDIRKPSFIGMSLKPGIASEYYQENKLQIHTEDLVKYQKKFDLFKSKPPRYFDKLFDAEDPEAFDKIKRKRAAAGVAARKAKFQLFSESEHARLLREEKIAKDKEDKYYVRGL